MAKKLRFLWNNLIDQAVLTASSADAEFPVANVAHDLFLKAWRSTGFATESVVANLSALASASRQVRAWAVKYHNLVYAAGDSYKIQGSDNDLAGVGDPGGGDVDLSFTPTTEMIVGFFSAAKDFDYWRWILNSPASKSAGEYQRVGRIFLGDYFQPTFDVTVAPEAQPIDPSELLKTHQGQEYANLVTQYEILTYLWDMLPDSDVASFKTMFQAVGKSKPFFICENANAVGGAYTVTRYVKFYEDPIYRPVINGWKSVSVRVKTER